VDALQALIAALYGLPPPPPVQVRLELRHAAVVPRWHGASLQSGDVVVAADDDGAGLRFALQWVLPALPATHESRGVPVLVSGDGCWPHYLDADTVAAGLQHGLGLAWFDRTAVAPDPPQVQSPAPSSPQA
jgi:hypothetical protein